MCERERVCVCSLGWLVGAELCLQGKSDDIVAITGGGVYSGVCVRVCVYVCMRVEGRMVDDSWGGKSTTAGREEGRIFLRRPFKN